MIKIVAREEWGALPPLRTTPLEHPIVIVGFSYSEPTNIFDRETVKQLQRAHRNTLQMDDIQSNFLIGRDGTIYEGRGWHVQPHPALLSDVVDDGNFMEIGFIGNFEGQPQSHPAFESMRQLLQHGQNCGYIAKEYIFAGDLQKKGADIKPPK